MMVPVVLLKWAGPPLQATSFTRTSWIFALTTTVSNNTGNNENNIFTERNYGRPFKLNNLKSQELHVLFLSVFLAAKDIDIFKFHTCFFQSLAFHKLGQIYLFSPFIKRKRQENVWKGLGSSRGM